MAKQTQAPAAPLLVINPSLDRVGRIDVTGFDGFTERHHFTLPSVTYGPLLSTADVSSDSARHVMVVMDHGLPNRGQLALAAQIIASGKRFYFCWPDENAVELVDSERLGSLKRHRYAYGVAIRVRALIEKLKARSSKPPVQTVSEFAGEMDHADASTGMIALEATNLSAHLKDGLSKFDKFSAGTLSILGKGTSGSGETARIAALSTEAGIIKSFISDSLPGLERIKSQSADTQGSLKRLRQALAERGVDFPGSESSTNALFKPAVIFNFLNEIANDPRPVPFAPESIPDAGNRLAGTGMYLRLDFWAPLTSGGSYGHTCYQAQALAETSEDFLCVVANRFDMLDEMGLKQIVVPGQNMIQTEANILGMNMHYRDRLGVMFEAVKPAYIMERAVLGSAVGAWASRTFGIPYIVEYNGSEISMKRSFAGQGYEHENLLLLAEDAAFRQATMISVISDHVAADVARRRIPESKIVVNPNAVDLNAYSPATPEGRKALRADLGFSDEHKVVGFIGTFGGWHGIDVLSAAMPLIAKADPSIRFLLIGDGNMKNMVHETIANHNLADRVVDAGRVPQARGAELLKACDILVSPHSRNMVDSPFFGSPTKLFEYMAMGVGIVASDLEQIAHVMSPALRVHDFAGGAPKVTDQRSIMCRPGDVDDFVAGVVTLARHPEISAALGRNARQAAERYYTWRQHVRNLWLAMSGKSLEGYAVDRSIGTNG